MWNFTAESGNEAKLLRDRVRDELRIEAKGDGWTIGFVGYGSYIECWHRKSIRCVECNFFDNSARSSDWTKKAALAMTLALHWQEEGVMLTMARPKPVNEG